MSPRSPRPSGRSHNCGADIRTELLARRYLMRDEESQVIERPQQMFQRVAEHVAAAEARYGASPEQISRTAEQFYRLMVGRRFLPNSPTLMNAGQRDGLLSACFVLPVEDSVEEIFDAIKCTALIQKAGGGTGFAFDSIRPCGDVLRSGSGRASGPISFWRVFAQATEAIQQGAHRRGANMGMMSVEHPDILKFIYAKRDPSAFNNFNISVKLPDAFMAALKQSPDTPHVVVNPRTSRRYLIPRGIDTRSYILQDLIPLDESRTGCYSVQDIWNLVITSAYANGEPGVCFVDRMNDANPTPALGQIKATNPHISSDL